MADLRRKVGHDLILLPGVAVIIRDSAGRILLQQNKEGIWNLPAGAVDPGEAPAQAVVREVREDTGMRTVPRKIAAVLGGAPEHRLTYKNGDVVESTTIVFECQITGGELKPQDDETKALEHFDIADIPDLAITYPRQIFSSGLDQAFFEWENPE